MTLSCEALLSLDPPAMPQGVIARLIFAEGIPGGGLRAKARCGREFCVSPLPEGAGCEFFAGASKAMGKGLFQIVCRR
jgi:hypothetical protein